MTSTPSFFPVGSKVILQNLVKGAQYNGEQGKVTGPLRQSSQRQNVFVESINKTMAIKPVNMVYVPRDLSSLERDEMINLIKSEAETKVVVEMEALIIEGEASKGMFMCISIICISLCICIMISCYVYSLLTLTQSLSHT